jgi:hypothetical protein
MHRFDLKKLNDAGVKKQYQVKISNRFPAFENLNDNVDINRACKNITDNINIFAKNTLRHFELKQHKSWFDEEH